MLVDGLVSTIIPVHNRPALLREAVASVLAQTYRPIEIIIVNDGSTDETGREAEALAKLIRRFALSIVRTAAPARRAKQDVWRHEANSFNTSTAMIFCCRKNLSFRLLVCDKTVDCVVSYGKTRFYAYGDRPSDVAWKRTGERISTMFPSFLQSRWWGTSTPLYRREVTDRAGPWTELRNEEDWEYDCRIAREWGSLTLLRNICLGRTDYSRRSLEYGRLYRPGKA